MSTKKIAIACQGGGSQCAFVAGALKTLLARGVQDRFRIVGLSGTSGGALTAAVAWNGLLLRGQPDHVSVADRIVALWKDLSARTPREVFLDGICTQMVRLAEQGMVPTIASSPSTPAFRFWSKWAAAFVARPEFTDLRVLLDKHIDFQALPGLDEPDSPTLRLGAGDVLQGDYNIFTSARGDISPEALLASAAIPNIFPAVWVNGHAYWDGIFACNPPVMAFLREVLVGKGHVPDEIWIIQVNPATHEYVPETSAEISNRRNHLAGNLSLLHELQMIDVVNLLLSEGALTPAFRARFGLDATERIAVRFIRMSKELAQGLDYPSKLSRMPGHIDGLMAEGERQANAFLADLDAAAFPALPATGTANDNAEQFAAEKQARW
jgi:NTE family protein